MRKEIDILAVVFACCLLVTHGWILGVAMLLVVLVNIINNHEIDNKEIAEVKEVLARDVEIIAGGYSEYQNIYYTLFNYIHTGKNFTESTRKRFMLGRVLETGRLANKPYTEEEFILELKKKIPHASEMIDETYRICYRK